jgi:hypothetical protein
LLTRSACSTFQRAKPTRSRSPNGASASDPGPIAGAGSAAATTATIAQGPCD